MQTRRLFRTLRTGGVLALAAVGVVIAVTNFSSSKRVQAQESGGADPDPPEEQSQPSDPARELAQLAIMNPQAYCDEVAKYKTTEQLAEEQAAAYAIEHPAEFCAALDAQKSPELRAYEQQAAYAIQQPAAYCAELDASKSPEQLAQEAAVAFAIQSPERQLELEARQAAEPGQ